MTLPRDRDLVLLERWRATVREAVGDHLSPGSRIALINYPDHSNVGDLAISLGTMKVLRELDVRVAYVCDARTYHPEAMSRSGELDWLVIHGGGNFGDLWELEQQMREQVFRDFPTTPTLQLPQSVRFQDEANLRRAQAVMRRHECLHLLWREERSLLFAEENLPGHHALCPDMALALDPQSREVPELDVLWLSRTDKEGRYAAVPGALGEEVDVEVTDWVDPSVGPPPGLSARLAFLVHGRLQGLLGGDRNSSALQGPYRATLETMAAHHLRRGLAVLGRGRVVVTDRLHGHILSLLMGIPHLVLDNLYGKVRSVFDSWTSESACAHWVDRVEDVPREVRRLLGDRWAS